MAPWLRADRRAGPRPAVVTLLVTLGTSAPCRDRINAGQECGEGQNRTADTAIFSRVLCQLSYLAGLPRIAARLLASVARPSGAVRSAHLPVKEKAAGSNPVWGARSFRLRVRIEDPQKKRTGFSGPHRLARTRTPPFQGGDHGFESRWGHHSFLRAVFASEKPRNNQEHLAYPRSNRGRL